jgi:hypothetical protein
VKSDPLASKERYEYCPVAYIHYNSEVPESLNFCDEDLAELVCLSSLSSAKEKKPKPKK